MKRKTLTFSVSCLLRDLSYGQTLLDKAKAAGMVVEGDKITVRNEGIFWTLRHLCRADVASTVSPADIPARTPTPPPKPVPFKEWPWWAKQVYRLRADKDVGVGRTIKRILDAGGGEAIEMILKLANVQCGCNARRIRFDRLYPYAK